jgi:hypothetical protein
VDSQSSTEAGEQTSISESPANKQFARDDGNQVTICLLGTPEWSRDKFSAQNSVYLGKIEKLFSADLIQRRFDVIGLFMRWETHKRQA